MRVAVMLPTFEATSAPALRAAAAAEAAGLHGVLCYDHLWPMGHPGQPALSPFPLLGALAGATSSLALGTLVARIGLEPDDVLVAKFETLQGLAGSRLIAALGTGDHKSEDENVGFGIEAKDPSARRHSVGVVADRLIEFGIEVWIGGGRPETNEVARARGLPLNLWGADLAQVAAAAAEGPVTWGGVLPRDEARAVVKLAGLEEAGVTWAAFSWPGSVQPVVAAARRAGIALASR